MDPFTLILLVITLILALVIVYLLARRSTTASPTDLTAQLHELQTGLAELQVHAQHRQAETQSLTSNLHQVQRGLGELRSTIRARQDLERQTMESVRRLETVIAGTQTKGAAGENILDAVFSQLPAEWQLRNFRLANRTVEFGLRLPNGLVLPIDSKWPATYLTEQFAQAETLEEQQQIKARIEKAVRNKALEVRKYLDPNLTTPFGVAVVPDMVYDLSTGVQAEAFSMNVVLISYSLFVPYLLLVFQTVLKNSQSIDVHRLEAYLNHVEENLDALQEEVEGRLARALRMLNNSRGNMRTQVSQVRGGLHSIQVGMATPGQPNDTQQRDVPIQVGLPGVMAGPPDSLPEDTAPFDGASSDGVLR